MEKRLYLRVWQRGWKGAGYIYAIIVSWPAGLMHNVRMCNLRGNFEIAKQAELIPQHKKESRCTTLISIILDCFVAHSNICVVQAHLP